MSDATDPIEAAEAGKREKQMTGEITPFRWYVVQGFPPRLQWMERTMPPQWHDVPMVFAWEKPEEARASSPQTKEG